MFFFNVVFFVIVTFLEFQGFLRLKKRRKVISFYWLIFEESDFVIFVFLLDYRGIY